MNDADMIKRAKENWKCWQGLKETEPDLAAWMNERRTELLYLSDSISWTKRALQEAMLNDSNIYRLRADYQPPVKRWVFNPKTRAVDCTYDATIKTGCIEISESFARYVQNKPDGECELRKPETGDSVYALDILEWVTWEPNAYMVNKVNYRWCRPRKVAVSLDALIEARRDASQAIQDAWVKFLEADSAMMDAIKGGAA